MGIRAYPGTVCACHSGGNDLPDGIDLLLVAAQICSAVGNAQGIEWAALDCAGGRAVGDCDGTLDDAVARPMDRCGAGPGIGISGAETVSHESDIGVCLVSGCFFNVGLLLRKALH